MVDLTFKELFILLRKRWRFIALFTVISLAITFYLSYYRLTPMYASSSTILVNDRNHNQNSISLNDIMLNEKLIGTYKDIIVSKRILKSAANRFNISYEQLVSMINVTSRSNSQVITLNVTSDSHRQATDIANFVTETFRDRLPEIMTIDNVQILDQAEYVTNPRPIKPNKPLNMALALLLGLFVSSSLTVMMHFIDSRIRSDEELSLLMDYPILGTIPRYDKHSRRNSNYMGA